MANAQPANATISVTRRARVYFDNRRHTSIKHLTTPFDSRLVAVPGEENLVLETRDTFYSDAFPNGHRVVVYPRTVETLKAATTNLTNVKVVKLPGNERELQIEKNTTGLRDDLYGQLAADQAGGLHV